jgi:hypothetical protein
MIEKGKLSRRSFLASVTGGAVALGAGAVVTGGVGAQQPSGVTDNDTGRNSDPVGNGRGGSDRAGNGRACSDNDQGGRADPGGRGRSSTDSD